MGQLSSRLKKATCAEHVHEQQPCVLLKYTTTTAENHPHQLDETPGGAGEIDEGRNEAGRDEEKTTTSGRFRLFRKRAGKYDLVQAEKVYQSEAGSYQKITDDHTPLQHITIVENPDHQEAPASEVLPDAEEQLEQDVLQPQDVDAPLTSAEDESMEELDKDQVSLPHIVEIPDPQEAPASEVLLPDAEEQLEQDVLQPQDVDAPLRSAEDESMEELDKDQVSLLHIVEIPDPQEYPASEVLLPDAEEQLEQDVLQPQDVDTPVCSTEDDSMEELDMDQTSPQHIGEINDPGEAPASQVLHAAEEQLEQDVLQPLDVNAPAEDDSMDELDNGHIFWRYEFGHKLGQGGFGYVQAGTRCKDGVKVALKIAEKKPNMPYILVPGHPKRLPMEIGLTLMANKGPRVPQIIKLLDWQDDPDHYIMVMERPIPCTNMLSFIKLQGGRLDERTARHVMQQVIHAANVCCERGVFHRDIKPENVLINHDTLEVKLIDFGCGELMKESAYVAFRGTRVYCPPEYHVNGGYHAKPATVWSLGILLFATVCGYYPSYDDLLMISEDKWCEPGLSQECCQMISASLQPDPEQRLRLEEMRLHDWFKVMV
ncbi:serine/threonine-protein kinase GRIK2-like isoform X2 [Megalobrama amblycephala]|uniref:serine/threonine-protein kinase GRIK2-like isoform X2 n=1 Tax=Megalobrama amblycephala TaxID=75352 RepID=UPI00201434EB|nr:serine/threonine-protein kinase GRIK2-like isoform X2 [Megalobrama amblycephala]